MPTIAITTAMQEPSTTWLRVSFGLWLICDMPPQPHDRHDKKQDHEEKQSAGDGVIPHPPCTFKPLSLPAVIIHPAIRDGIGAIPAACSTNTAANTANRYRMETANKRRACGSRSWSRSIATRKL